MGKCAKFAVQLIKRYLYNLEGIFRKMDGGQYLGLFF